MNKNYKLAAAILQGINIGAMAIASMVLLLTISLVIAYPTGDHYADTFAIVFLSVFLVWFLLGMVLSIILLTLTIKEKNPIVVGTIAIIAVIFGGTLSMVSGILLIIGKSSYDAQNMSAAIPTNVAQPSSNLEARLNELNRLLEKNIITQAEYDQSRKHIFDQM